MSKQLYLKKIQFNVSKDSMSKTVPWVIYWLWTEPSIKRCTCVNKRKNSGSSWTIDNNITRCPDGSSQLESRCRSETSCRQRALGPYWPPVEQPKLRCERSAAIPVSNSSFIHNKHHPFENKVWEIYFYHQHHHVVQLARISLTLSRHFSRSFIASGRSSRLHPVSSHSCCMYVLAGHPAFARLYVGVHRSTLLMSSSLLLRQCPACLVRLTWIVFVMGGRWPYSWCLVECCRQDLFNIARNILV